MIVTEQMLKEHREKRREIHQIRKMLNDDILSTESQEATHMKDYYTSLLREYNLEHYEIEKALIRLSVGERMILREYYLSKNEKTWEEVSLELHYSIQHTFRMKKTALQKLFQSK